MYNPDAPMVTMQGIQAATALQKTSKYVVRTPMLLHVQDIFEIDPSIDLNLKLENMQVTGKPIKFGHRLHYDSLIDSCWQCVNIGPL